MHSTRAFHLIALLALAACGDDDGDTSPRPLGGSCGQDSDCVTGLGCEYRICQQPCNADSECPGSERCVRGVTTDDAGSSRRVCLPAALEACTDALDCLGRQVCSIGECRDECTSTTQCGSGQTCRDNDRCFSNDPNKDPRDGGV